MIIKYINFKVIAVIVCFMVSLTAIADWVQPKLGHTMMPTSNKILAPSFELEDMDGELVNSKVFNGKVIMLNFWATWCPPCKREMPSMERLYQKFKNNSFTVLAINQMESDDTVFSFTGQLPIDPTFTILFDKSSKVSAAYNVNGLPTTYLIDKKGVIRYRAIGGREFDHPKIEKIITELINE